MNISFLGRSKSSVKRLISYWFIAAIFGAMCLTACQGESSAYPNSYSDGINLPLIRLDIGLTQVALGPADVSDLFKGATYSISQSIMSPESQGIMVTYPTEFLPHTTAFAYGFLTRIEIFTNIDLAVKSYDITLTQQSGEALAIKLHGDASQAFVRTALTPEGADLNSTEYAVLFRDRNAVAIIILRTDEKVSPDRLNQLTELVLGRLRP